MITNISIFTDSKKSMILSTFPLTPDGEDTIIFIVILESFPLGLRFSDIIFS